MTNEELVYSYQQGDAAALGELIEMNEGIIKRIVNKFYTDKTNSIDKEDLKQEAYVGLIHAAKRYDFHNEHKAQFITYAVHLIQGNINTFITTRNTNDETSLNKPVKNNKEGEEDKKELQDFIEGVDYSLENVLEKLYREQLRGDLEQVMNESTSLKEREVLKLFYGWYSGVSHSMSEISELFGIPCAAAQSTHNKAVRKLRKSRWALTEGQLYLNGSRWTRKICGGESVQSYINNHDAHILKRGV